MAGSVARNDLLTFMAMTDHSACKVPIAESAPAAPKRLEGLPLHIIEEICKHLTPTRAGRRSLRSLSLASRALAIASARSHFKTIRVVVRVGARLPDDVQTLEGMLAARDGRRYVRQLEISGSLSMDAPEWDSPSDGWPTAGTVDCIADEWPPQDDFWTTPGEPTHFEPAEPDLTQAPLAAFTSGLPQLRDVVYACRDQIPATLLTALHSHPHRPRLRVHSFSLRSLWFEHGAPVRDVDPDEYLLASSPLLTSIRVQDTSNGLFNAQGHSNYNEDAVLHMVAGEAPTLWAMSVWLSKPRTPHDSAPLAVQPWLPWPGFFRGRPSPAEGGFGALKALTLVGEDETLSLRLLDAWRGHTNFGALRSLHLRLGAISVGALQSLASCTRHQGLRSLHTLNLQAYSPFPADQRSLYFHLAHLIRSLRPLVNLQIEDIFGDQTFDAMLSHGPSLRKLRLIPEQEKTLYVAPYVLSRAHIERLAHACPDLANLELRIQRSKAEEEEVRTYRALSELRRLDCLSLLLDYSTLEQPTDVSEADLTEDERQLPEPQDWVHPKPIRDAYINAAVDHALAREIFDCVSRRHSPRVASIRTVCAANFSYGGADPVFSLIARHLERHWVQVRSTHDGLGACYIEEIGTAATRNPGRGVVDPIDAFHADILKTIWPAADGIWRENWRGFPLWKETSSPA
ncbi:uncharacterized protein DNG_09425 [Cephalotrichum gorgonifer]|uniref:Uncharacterized protein n=1 Tax=Cephalotrichum gorgonifer TaxID=2041049 RepID=A0AAE8N5N9_9PEZI|nr:uncharacterized protein DNG_09425 [Cephalotrichum gorgonifer]